MAIFAVMIELRDFSIGFGGRTLLSHVNATFHAGRLTALLGRNGTGKSTLLRAIARLNGDYGGEVWLGSGGDASLTDSLSQGEMARRLAFVSTRRVRVDGLRCRDAVALGRAPHTSWTGNLSDTDRAAVERAMTITDTLPFAARHMHTLSDGECQRVMIARAVAQDTGAMLLDEPTSFLDMPARYSLASILGRLAREEGKCVLFSTHELDIALRMCDDVALVTGDGALVVLPAAEMAAGHYLRTLFAVPGIDMDVVLRI